MAILGYIIEIRKKSIEMSTWLGLLSGVPLLYQTGLLHALVDPKVGEYSDERDEIDNPTAHRRARGNNTRAVY